MNAYPLPEDDCDYGSLDPGIREFVEKLRPCGMESFESCEGGEGHSYAEPTIRFHGNHSEGHRILAAAIQFQLPVYSLRRVWVMQDGEPTGPHWELAFSQKAGPVQAWQEVKEELGIGAS